MWMTAASLAGLWLWRTGAVRRLMNVPMTALVPAMLAVTVLCKSLGALALLVCGAGVLHAAGRLRTAAPIVLLLAFVPVYLGARVFAGWEGDELVTVAAHIDESRAASLETRLANENRLVGRALEKPLFGWGGWGDYRDVYGKVITDSFWIITLGQNGLIGLTAGVLLMLMPVACFLRRVRVRNWDLPVAAPAAALAVVWLLFAYDSMFNFMFNPVFVFAAGGLISIAVCMPRRRVHRAAAAPNSPRTERGGLETWPRPLEPRQR
jgi:hypothetical protein